MCTSHTELRTFTAAVREAALVFAVSAVGEAAVFKAACLSWVDGVAVGVASTVGERDVDPTFCFVCIGGLAAAAFTVGPFFWEEPLLISLLSPLPEFFPFPRAPGSCGTTVQTA